MELDLLQRIVKLISEETSIKVDRISPDSTLFGDLAIDGSDAADLLERFFIEFEIDVQDFKFQNYFGPEAGCNPISFIYYIFKGRLHNDLIPIRVEDLVEAAESKKWPSRLMPLENLNKMYRPEDELR